MCGEFYTDASFYFPSSPTAFVFCHGSGNMRAALKLMQKYTKAAYDES